MRLNRDLSKIKQRAVSAADAGITGAVRGILDDVKNSGDSAVRKYAEKFDGFKSDNLLVEKDEIPKALLRVGEDFARLLNKARERITAFHANQVSKSWMICRDDGTIMGQIARPIRRVGLYVPGGAAAYPSTLLMNAVPAALAGVNPDDIAIFTPSKADGKVADAILAAAACCGVHTIYRIGGAHAIAAAAYGTESISRVDKIVGPGNIYVATAKRLVYGEVDIDMIAGPSEVLIIADETASPRYIAADLMSQAEHDILSSCVLISTSERLIEETEREITRQLEKLSRRNTVEESLRNYGAAVLVDGIDDAFDIANDVAPEHLEILTLSPIEHLTKVRNAGSIFLGENTPEPLGDYMSGTNHVLPTNGTARFRSPLGVYDFMKFSSYSYYTRDGLATLRDDTIKFAEIEGLDAHANSIRVRFED